MNSCICNSHNTFKEEYNCTIGVEFWVKSLSLENDVIDLQLWDTCGQERYRTITKQYYRDIDGCILVFDLSEKQTFKNLQIWLEDLSNNGVKYSNVLLVGNKTDLIDKRQVNEKDIEEFALLKNLKYIEASAKTGSNVLKCFQEIAKIIILNEKDLKKGKNSSKNVTINKSVSLLEHKSEVKNKNKKCCF